MINPPLEYSCIPFKQLSVYELYACMKLRQEVFIIEQDCNYLDADGKDLDSHHVMGKDNAGFIKSYARILPPGLAYEGYASIGRVINHSSVRGTGEGKRLMEYAITAARLLYPHADIKISAQSYLLRFYGNLGFIAEGEEYLEDDIPHTAMVLKT
jgi:ElaA protein